MAAIGPVDIEVCRGVTAQSEVQARIIGGVKTRLTQYGLSLRFSAVAGYHSSADRAAIRFHSLQFYFEPVLLPLDIISQ